MTHEVHMTCWVGSSHSSNHPACLWTFCLVKVKTKYFWFATWPHIWIVTWLCVWVSLILIWGPYTIWEWRYNVFYLSSDHDVKVLRDIVGGVASSQYTTLLSLGSIGLVKVKIQRFWFATRPRGRCVTWFCRSGPLILSYHPAKCGVHRSCESGNITFFICHVITILKCHVSLWVGSPHPKSLSC